MNVNRILALANYIEHGLGSGFHMGSWHHCICGQMFQQNHQGRLQDRILQDNGCSMRFAEIVSKELGIGFQEAWQLIVPEQKYLEMCLRSDAVRVLRELAITGKVNWAIILEPALPTPNREVRKVSVYASSLAFFADLVF